jgi:topoisomerase-4 subunit B
LRAKAVLCPGLQVSFRDEASGERLEWCYADGLHDYLAGALGDTPALPEELFTGRMEGNSETAEWALAWLPEGGELVAESYVNLIPTVQGGTHVNGLRMGLTEAVREFCEFRNLYRAG